MFIFAPFPSSTSWPTYPYPFPNFKPLILVCFTNLLSLISVAMYECEAIMEVWSIHQDHTPEEN